MTIKLNLADVQTELTAVPAGNYAVTVSSVQETLSKSSNKPMLAVKLRIEEPEDQAGRILFDNFSLQPQALWKLKRWLLALGYAEDEIAEFELDPEELVGLDCVAAVIVEPFIRNQGTEAEEQVERNRISAYALGNALEVGIEGEAAETGFDFDFD